MKTLRPINRFLFSTLGFVFGAAVTLGVIAFVVLSRPSFFNREKQASRPQPVTGSEEITLKVYPEKGIRGISPFIYGSNLAPLTEFEMDVAKFAKDIGITNFRYPGGTSEGHHWQTGKFDRNNRYDNAPINKLDNLATFCNLSQARLVLQVNIGTGTPLEAAQWVLAMNRDRNMRVDYWELGNEVYGDWDADFMTAEEYAKVIRQYARAMKSADTTIKIGANFGGPNYPLFDEALLKEAAEDIDFVSYHWYPNHTNEANPEESGPHPKAEDIMANSLNVGPLVERVDRILKKYAPHRQGKIEVCFLEWDGSWDARASDLNSEYKGMMWSLADAIFYADTLGQFALHGVSVANHYAFQNVMFGLIRGWDREAGWGGSRWDGVTIRPKALALQLFAKHFGKMLVESELEGSPVYEKKPDLRADSYAGKVPYVSAYASRFMNDGKLAVVVINKHAEKDFRVKILFEGALPKSEGTVWVLNGPSLESQNDGSPGTVAITERKVRGFERESVYTAPAHSVSLIQVALEDRG